MIFKQRSIMTTLSILSMVLLTALLAACGNSSTGAASTPTPTSNCLTVATGTIQSFSNNSLQVTNLQGNTVQAMLSSATTFVRQETFTPANLKNGMLVSVIVKQNADNTYSALMVNVRTSLTRQGGLATGARLCSGQRQRGGGGFGFGGGTPGAGSGTGAGQSRQTINGTISQMSGNSLTVTDTSGNDFTITLTTTTRISAQQTASASDLQSGEAVTITGSANSQGVINASAVSILQGLPRRRGTPTATPTANA